MNQINLFLLEDFCQTILELEADGEPSKRSVEEE
jgi:hypothetical protein